jgi:hypothetical protein
MGKLCKYCGIYPVFSHNYCKTHQYLRRSVGGDLHNKQIKSKSVNKKIPSQSAKRKEELKAYKELSKDIWDEAVANKSNKCFFCGEVMLYREDVHHLDGRENDRLINREYLTLAHNNCHVYKYHAMTYEQLCREPWYSSFLLRLKSISEELYNKEISKGLK